MDVIHSFIHFNSGSKAHKIIIGYILTLLL